MSYFTHTQPRRHRYVGAPIGDLYHGRTLPEVWRPGTHAGHGGRGAGRTPPPRWAKPSIHQRCPGGRLNPGAASY
eukprot:4408881-Prymnesium_polylepis.1